MTDHNEQLTEGLLRALDGPYRELRQDNHVDPEAILVYDAATETVEAITLNELPLRYPAGPGNRWSYEDLGAVVAEKAALYRQSVIATEISDEDPEAEPTVGTVVLAITENHRPYQRLIVKSRILPGQVEDDCD
jgi:hypothetical protein